MQDVDQMYETFDSELDVLESDEQEFDEESPMLDSDSKSPFSEEEATELAAELLEITDEAELDLFLGKLFRRARRGIKKVGKKLRPLGKILKVVAKKALPIAGGVAGSFIPIPVVGSTLGSALGSAVSRAFEMEFEGMSPDDQEFEKARRFVNMAGTAARHAAMAPPTANPLAAAKSAVLSAAKQQVSGMIGSSGSASLSRRTSGRTGRWVRNNGNIIVMGA